MQPAPIKPVASLADLEKLDVRLGTIRRVSDIPGAEKLVALSVSFGDHERTIVAGIAAAYTPEELVGRKVVIVANLQPRKLKGIESNGMIVAASVEGGQPVLAGFLEDIPAGARLK